MKFVYPPELRFPPHATTSRRPCGQARWSSFPARRVPARPRSCRRSCWTSGAARMAARSSHAASPYRRTHRSRNASPPKWECGWATKSAIRCVSPMIRPRPRGSGSLPTAFLPAQIQRDPKLSAYDTIVIDEAHERSLEHRFPLGYLTALLPQRRDLKLIITSATIDSVKFQQHFEHALHTKKCQ